MSIKAPVKKSNKSTSLVAAICNNLCGDHDRSKLANCDTQVFITAQHCSIQGQGGWR